MIYTIMFMHIHYFVNRLSSWIVKAFNDVKGWSARLNLSTSSPPRVRHYTLRRRGIIVTHQKAVAMETFDRDGSLQLSTLCVPFS